MKNYSSPLEEARADLVALYFLMDPKLVEMGLIPSLDVGKAAYNSFILNGLMLQLRRIEPGNTIEQAHMRNRQMVAAWVYEKGLAETDDTFVDDSQTEPKDAGEIIDVTVNYPTDFVQQMLEYGMDHSFLPDYN